MAFPSPFPTARRPLADTTDTPAGKASHGRAKNPDCHRTNVIAVDRLGAHSEFGVIEDHGHTRQPQPRRDSTEASG
ncbi:hypothetical protein GCM10010388_02060 [Streptomyces mauvecolor]